MGKLTHSECLTHLLICLLLAITLFSLYFQLIHYLPINSVKASSIAPDVSPTFFFSKPPCLNVPIKYVAEAIFLREVLNLSCSLCLSDVNAASSFWPWGKLCGVSVFAILVLSGTHVSHCLLTSFIGVPAIPQCNAPRSPAWLLLFRFCANYLWWVTHKESQTSWFNHDMFCPL